MASAELTVNWPKRPKLRLYVADDLAADAAVTLAGGQAHYLAHVMRARPGEAVALFNGRDGEWRAEITVVGKKQVTLGVGERIAEQVTGPDLWLVFAPVKRARIDFVAQKATELGASALLPVFTDFTAVDRTNTDRLAANAREAAEQCLCLAVPEIRAPQKLAALLADWPEDRALIFCDETAEGTDPLGALAGVAPGPAALLIGPEGGFSDAERVAIRALPQATAISLGPRLLRADTAAVAALTLWQAARGDWR
ncbi:MAG: 16S rRNA (uracil(1498)-N(3))-methyltransferase [Sphingomonadales bacterium]|nr:16S rRNA (uracil(1498)-N(3))-methyltransferase [Sphingomonadales bacterium]